MKKAYLAEKARKYDVFHSKMGKKEPQIASFSKEKCCNLGNI